MANTLQTISRQLRSYARLEKEATLLIHIGKCGGGSLRKGIRQANIDWDIRTVHVRKPVYRRDLKYIIVARSPISRLKSAFRWRKKLVIDEGIRKDGFEDEYDVLVKYECLNNLAEALYSEEGEPDKIAQQDIRKIHHIKEDIAFYLRDLLAQCRPSQITAVLMQENLDSDIQRVFGYKNEVRQHLNPMKAKDKDLSPIAVSNLMRFFHEDYEALTKLYCWGKIDPQVFAKAMQYGLM